LAKESETSNQDSDTENCPDGSSFPRPKATATPGIWRSGSADSLFLCGRKAKRHYLINGIGMILPEILGEQNRCRWMTPQALGKVKWRAVRERNHTCMTLLLHLNFPTPGSRPSPLTGRQRPRILRRLALFFSPSLAVTIPT
jgi:hypothetical protein